MLSVHEERVSLPTCLWSSCTNCSTEYIGQLEGELAGKVDEANDLRAQNQQLREENTRLTDLTRMLLSSQAFSGFLQELSQSGMPPPNFQKGVQQQKPIPTQAQPQPRPTKKDVNTTTAAKQMHSQQPQIGMALIPETPVDYPVLQPNGWMSALPTNDFQVYAVTEMPTPPVLDLEALSGKPTSSKVTSKAKQMPQLPEIPTHMSTSASSEPDQVDDSIALDQDAFTLYFTSTTSDVEDAPKEIQTNMEVGQPFNEGNWAALEKLCSDLEDSCEKLADYTSHME